MAEALATGDCLRHLCLCLYLWFIMRGAQKLCGAGGCYATCSAITYSLKCASYRQRYIHPAVRIDSAPASIAILPQDHAATSKTPTKDKVAPGSIGPERCRARRAAGRRCGNNTREFERVLTFGWMRHQAAVCRLPVLAISAVSLVLWGLRDRTHQG